MIDLWTAFARLMRLVSPLTAEDIAVEDAVGRAAARSVRAGQAVPGFRRAMMDGYVCHADDLAADAPRPTRLRLTGTVHVGELPTGAPGRGEAWAITTGGPLPTGTDAVIPFENTRRDGDTVFITEPPRKPHVGPADEDVRIDETLIEAGDRLTMLSVVGLAATGLGRMSVTRRPRVAVLATGDEVVDSADATQAVPPGCVSNVNGPVLKAELRSLGCAVRSGGVVGDDPDTLTAALAAALRDGADVVLTTGGVSVGPHDYVARCWRQLGATTILAGVDVKPGWPVYVGQLDGRWVIGLSGTPAACLTTYHVLIRPLLLRLAGFRHVVRPIVPVVASTPFSRPAEHTRLLWANVSGDGPLYAAALRVDDRAGKLTAIGRSNAIAIVPAGRGPIEPGDRLWALCLDLPEDRATLTLGEQAGFDVPALCIVGASGSGKTTAATGLVQRLRRRGLDVLAIKHAAHGFELDRPGSDSQRLLAAGASASWVSGPGAVAMTQCTASDDPDPERLVRLAVATHRLSCGAPPDLVLLEGFSRSALPRVQVGVPKPGTECAGEIVVTLVERFSEEDLDGAADAIWRRLRPWPGAELPVGC